jgi:hypothetical protein
MIALSFLIQYYFMSYVMTNSSTNITNSIGKLYLALIMAFSMGLLDCFIMGDQIYLNYIVLIVLLFITIIMYRQQKGIDDKNYLNEIIEHHSMALLTSKAIVDKTKDNRVKNLAQNIIKSQQSEINYIRQQLLQK